MTSASTAAFEPDVAVLGTHTGTIGAAPVFVLHGGFRSRGKTQQSIKCTSLMGGNRPT